ncbi:type IV pilus assembly protein PilM [Sporichthya sp.]|uniref:type IV pilus assembly protein PilM n=1 Tax=Sporichthya sp. TaxID=65475 RepID=UPI0017ECF877|nr:type IV pilus assembly protein PilM [Sporichthya sp.]MBA3742103.1 type IV pilus assembly protein PilM [Sporichthya sp.]
MKRSDARWGARKVVCLDIGSSGLRAAQFSVRSTPVGGKACRLDRYAAVPLPAGAVAGGVVTDPAAVGKALRALWSAGRFSTKRVVFGMANDRVLVRQLDLDWMEPADFRKALSYAVADQIPMSVDEANLDYHVLEDIPAGPDPDSERMLRILLVAAATEMVDTFLTALAEADLTAVKAELAPFALIRAAAPNVTAELDTDSAEAIVDIGADTLTVVVHANGQPRFVRTVGQLGGRVITGELQQKFGWSFEEAEAAKAQYGLPRQRAAGDDLVGLEHPAQQAIEERVAGVVAEVRTTLNFFLSAGTGVRSLSRVVLTGGGSRLTGLHERIAEAMDAEVVTLTTPREVRSRLSAVADDDLGAVALLSGLALGVI